ncbi:hypothetical protein Psuf_038910 [Phytohabitans suffuscus]|uniref:Uncharacterized protein n=1 Tax=Phytohabitans suffuscus TaxID=624315 RepID=A0A6F8YKU7_9ACTN|nr:hypothetical protein Psuf_038910 [Phytohabitans suffuscus]
MLYPLSYEGVATQGTRQWLPTGAGERRRPPTAPTPTGGAQTDRTAQHDLALRRSSLIVTDGRRSAVISIAATSEHACKAAASRRPVVNPSDFKIHSSDSAGNPTQRKDAAESITVRRHSLRRLTPPPC